MQAVTNFAYVMGKLEKMDSVTFVTYKWNASKDEEHKLRNE